MTPPQKTHLAHSTCWTLCGIARALDVDDDELAWTDPLIAEDDTEPTCKRCRRSQASRDLEAARKTFAIKPLTPKEAEAAYEAAIPAKLSKKRLKEIVDYATSGGAKFRDSGRTREWLDEIASKTLVAMRAKAVPSDVLKELLAAKFVRTYGRGRSHKVVATKEGLKWLK